MSESSVSTMGGAYFISRTDLLNWMNDLLKLDYTKLEMASNGAAFCQILDIIHPGKVPLKKVNFNANLEYDVIKNYKILQAAFVSVGIQKSINFYQILVSRLAQGKFQDILEFCQWFKQYYSSVMDGRELTDYDPIERRNAAGIKLSSNTISNTTSHHTTSSKKSKVENNEKKSNENISSLPQSSSLSDDKQNTHTSDIYHTSSTSTTHQISSDSTYNSPSSLTPSYSSSNSPASNQSTSIPPSNTPSPSSLEKRLSSLHAEMEELRVQTEPIEKERDFYFAKLQKVEEICMKDQNNETVKKILDVLAASEDDTEQNTETTGQ